MTGSEIKTGVVALVSLLLSFASTGGTLTLLAVVLPGSVPAGFAFV